MDTRKLAHIRQKQFDDGTIGFVLRSRDDELLLIGNRVPAHCIDRAVSDFILHCGLPDLYGVRAVEGAWLLDLFDSAGQRIGWAPPLDTRADALAVRSAVLHSGPILYRKTGGPFVAAEPQARACRAQ